MKTLYLECAMGAAGDMLTAALLELVEDRDAFLQKMNSIGLPGVRVEAEKAVKCGITGTHMKVTVDGVEEESVDAEGHDMTTTMTIMSMSTAMNIIMDMNTSTSMIRTIITGITTMLPWRISKASLTAWMFPHR